jgi:3-deoxy-manno-octulosonate cytidylyltransferase (CMP-KDO synthetase)
MIVHALRRATESGIGRVVVATDDERIAGAVREAGGEAVMTRVDHKSGSDRVFEAANLIDPGAICDIILNVQGDLPGMHPDLPRQCLAPLLDQGPDISTIGAEIVHETDRTNPNSVKIVATATGVPRRLRALYFTRATAPYGPGPLYHHFGMYAYRRAALERFVTLKPSNLEMREQLEQLRALEDGMRIDVTLVDSVPVEVNTPQDLELARQILTA